MALSFWRLANKSIAGGEFDFEWLGASADIPVVNDLHPTMKPVELFERALRNSSRSGNIVLDPFGGSGTTLIACEKTGRQARLMELDSRYVDCRVRRWQAWSGKTATLDGDGRSFDDVATERLRRVA